MDNGNTQVPAICREVGLSCKRCTEDSAASLAAVCKGLRGNAVTKLFVQIYPAAACASMSSHFARSYKEASRQAALPLMPNESFVRREMTRGVAREVAILHPRAAAAVA
jgi:hypothetical protein